MRGYCFETQNVLPKTSHPSLDVGSTSALVGPAMGFRYCRRTTLRCLQSTRGRFLFRLEAIGGSNSRDHFLGLCGGGGGARAAGGWWCACPPMLVTFHPLFEWLVLCCDQNDEYCPAGFFQLFIARIVWLIW